MAIGVYITLGVMNTFDEMEKLGIRKIVRIIGDLKTIYNDAPNYLEKTILSKETIKESTLREVLGNKYSDRDLEDFVRVFKGTSKNDPYDKGKYMSPNYFGLDKYATTDTGDDRPKQFSIKDMGNTKKQIEIESLPLKFTDDFMIMLDKIDDEICWSLLDLEENPDVKNKLGIEKIDVSDSDYNFDVYYPNGKRGIIKIVDFIRTYLGNKFNKGQVFDFTKRYNTIKNNALSSQDNLIEVPEFKFNPKDVRSTFISLVTETYPHGHEEEVYQYLPADLLTDRYGNLYKIIGDSDILFTSHLDTASRTKSSITLVEKEKGGQFFIMSDGTTILGADDKAGVTVMLYMMAHNIPGVYYFFLGEERGGIGSGKVSDDFSSFPFLQGIKKCVSFDRRNYFSVITEQMSVRCCSDEFAESLCDELNKSGLKLNLDPTGVFTDSFNFIDYIPECTNVSVGYFNEHTHDEIQNITYLERLAQACVACDWKKLVVKRSILFDSDILEKWKDLITELKETPYYNDITVKPEDGKVVAKIEFDDASLSNAYDDLATIEFTLHQYRCNPDIRFDGNTMKIIID
jgi:hypothetical protein